MDPSMSNVESHERWTRNSSKAVRDTVKHADSTAEQCDCIYHAVIPSKKHFKSAYRSVQHSIDAVPQDSIVVSQALRLPERQLRELVTRLGSMDNPIQALPSLTEAASVDLGDQSSASDLLSLMSESNKSKVSSMFQCFNDLLICATYYWHSKQVEDGDNTLKCLTCVLGDLSRSISRSHK